MAFNFPDSPSTGDQYVANTGKLYLRDSGSTWTTKGDTQAANPFLNYFKYRTIYTHGYTSGGYKNSSPWKNVNRTVHSTDVTTNLGDQLDYAASYKTGGFSDYHLYVYGCSDSHNAAASYVSSVSMSTETGRTHSSSWDLKTSRTDAEALMNAGLTTSYIQGGGSTNTDKHNLITETMYVAGSAPACFTAGGTNSGLGAFHGEFKGWISRGTTSGYSGYITWATELWTTNGISWATDGQPKGLSSKHGYGYGSTGTYNGSATLYRFDDNAGGSAVASMSRPESCGEENFQMGQNWGYTIGSYNGSAQTNNTTKISYLTDSCVAMGSDTQPKGHDGMSSGCCATASASLVGSK